MVDRKETRTISPALILSSNRSPMPRLLTMMATTSLLWRMGAATASWQPRQFSCSSSRRALAFLSNKSEARNNAIQILKNGGRPVNAAFADDRRYIATTAISSTPATSIEDDVIKTTKKPIPIVLLAGFLGAGKTSTLKHLLENNVNVRIGTIVNDVASVNIDAKLVSNVIGNINNNNGDGDRGSAGGENTYYADGGIVELQNGCACCSLADELLTSVIKLTDSGQRNLDAIVVELSGVADPMSVRDNWEQARLVICTHTHLAFVISSYFAQVNPYLPTHIHAHSKDIQPHALPL